MVYIGRGKSYKWDTKKLSPTQRLESLAERNFKPSGDKETDKETLSEIEKTLKQAKNDQG